MNDYKGREDDAIVSELMDETGLPRKHARIVQEQSADEQGNQSNDSVNGANITTNVSKSQLNFQATLSSSGEDPVSVAMYHNLLTSDFDITGSMESQQIAHLQQWGTEHANSNCRYQFQNLNGQSSSNSEPTSSHNKTHSHGPCSEVANQNVDSMNQILYKLLKEYLRHPTTWQSFYTFLCYDYCSHLCARGKTQYIERMNFSQSNMFNFLDQFREVFIKSDNISYTETVLEPDLNGQMIPNDKGEHVQSFHASSLEMKYYAMEPVLKTVPTIIARSGGPANVNKENVILTFGKKLFDVLFDEQEIMDGYEANKGQAISYDVNKTCLIARTLSWILSNPNEMSIQNLAEYSRNLERKMEYGLNFKYFSYFQKNVMQKHAFKRRQDISKKL